MGVGQRRQQHGVEPLAGAEAGLDLAALADPTRRAILARLALGETDVGELARPFDMTLPAISKHLKVLERAGLVSRSRDAQWRPCKLEPAPLRDAAGWVEQYRRFWETRLDRLEEYLRQAQLQENAQARADTGTKKKRDDKENHHGRKNPRR